ncbi:MAG: IPT/TIG domain-containing protein [Dysgonamonadaceae bacterium]
MERIIHLNFKKVYVIPLCLVFLHILFSCSDNIEPERFTYYPPSEGKTTGVTSYFPDSGGSATKLILRGLNFGSDTSYIKVTVNGRNAKVIGAADSVIYAIVPSRADTGFVKIFIGKGSNIKELAYDNKFKYQFKSNVTTLIGQVGLDGTDDGTYTTCKLRRPWFIASDKEGVLYIIDEGRGLSSDGGLRKAIDGTVTTLMRNSGGPMQSPTGLAFSLSQDSLYMLNSLWNENNMNTDATVALLKREEGFITIKPYVRVNSTSKATGMAVHPQTGDIFFNSQVDGYIYRYDVRTGTYTALRQVQGTDTELRLLFSKDGKTLYIVVKNKHCVYKANYNDLTKEIDQPAIWLGAWNTSGNANGLGTVARFNNPSQPAVDTYGNLYIPDKGNHCIRMVTPEGIVSTYAGIPGTSGSKDGLPSECTFNQPEAVCFNIDGGLYVADRGNHVIRKIMVE